MRLSLAHLLSIVGVVCASSAEAATYYVRNGGNDSADGTVARDGVGFA